MTPDNADRRHELRAEDRIIRQWQPWLDTLTDDALEAITLLIRGTCEAAQVDERYRVEQLAATLDTTRSALLSRFSHFRLPSLRDIQARVRLLCVIDRRESLARRFYNHTYTLEQAYGAAALCNQQALGRFLRRHVPEMRSASQWIKTADFADVATRGARFLFDTPNWKGFHVTQPNDYASRPARLVTAPRCAECGRPAYGKERATP